MRWGARGLLGLGTALLLTLDGTAPAGAEMTAVITRFTITRDGQPFLDDRFSGEYASLATPRMAGGGAVEYFVYGAIPDGSAVNGKLSLDSANGLLTATAEGRPRRITGARLMTNNDPQNARAGLKSGVTFSMSGLFDFIVPSHPIDGYGIRFADLPNPRKAAHVVNLIVSRTEAKALVIRFFHQDFEARKQYVVEDVPIDPSSGDQILLVLTRASLKDNEVTAQYQFSRNGVPVSAPVAVRSSAPVFGDGQRNWTRAEFLVFEQPRTPAK